MNICLSKCRDIDILLTNSLCIEVMVLADLLWAHD